VSAHFFSAGAEFRLNLQRLYGLRVAVKKTAKSIKALPSLKVHEHAQVQTRCEWAERKRLLAVKCLQAQRATGG
jgi:hypothetical protein